MKKAVAPAWTFQGSVKVAAGKVQRTCLLPPARSTGKEQIASGLDSKAKVRCTLTLMGPYGRFSGLDICTLLCYSINRPQQARYPRAGSAIGSPAAARGWSRTSLRVGLWSTEYLSSILSPLYQAPMA
jgi:hypothetical protein